MENLRQTILGFKLEETEKDSSLSSFAGIPLIYEIFRKLKLPQLISKHVKLKEAGWKEWEIVETTVGLVAAGGEHLEDVNLLQADGALLQLVEKEAEGGEAKNKMKELPSPKALERFLKLCHREQDKPTQLKCFVPEETKGLKGLAHVNQETVKRLINLSGIKTATIENDATAVFSHKEEAEKTYKGPTGYMPVIGSVAELGLVLHDEFRDGNIPPRYQVKAFFQKCLQSLPESITNVRTRLDGAYYEHDFISYLNQKNKRFGKIEFTITADKSASLIEWIEAIPEEEWKSLKKVTPQGIKETGKEWTELEWSSAEGTRETMRERTLRYVVTRKKVQQWELFQEENNWAEKKDRYEAIATNMDWQGQNLIWWHYERGGGIEHLHDRTKNDLAGGVLPCAEFGANAAWWRIQCLAWNLIRALQLNCLPEELKNCHLKRLRFKLLCIAGKVIQHARQVILKLSRGHPSFNIYRKARLRIAAMAVP